MLYDRKVEAGERLRCVVCSAPHVFDPDVLLDACPACETQIPPVRVEYDVSITINWSEFRLLATGAILAAKKRTDRVEKLKLIDAILARVSEQHPDLPGVKSTDIVALNRASFIP